MLLKASNHFIGPKNLDSIKLFFNWLFRLLRDNVYSRLKAVAVVDRAAGALKTFWTHRWDLAFSQPKFSFTKNVRKKICYWTDFTVRDSTKWSAGITFWHQLQLCTKIVCNKRKRNWQRKIKIIFCCFTLLCLQPDTHKTRDKDLAHWK